MFKRILEALRTQYAGVDAKVLVRMARKLAKQIKGEDEIEDKVAEVTLQDFIDMEGDRRATEAQTSAVSNYEKKYGLKNGKKANGKDGDEPQDDDDDDDDIDDDDIDDESVTNEPATRKHKPGTKSNRRTSRRESALEKQVKQLTESMQMLTGMMTKMQTERTEKTRRQQYEELFEGVDEKTKKRYMRDFDRLSFKDDEDFENWLTEKTAEVTEELAEMGYTTGGDNGDDTNADGQQPQGGTQQPGTTKTKRTPGIQQQQRQPNTINPIVKTATGARPPLGGRKNIKPGTVSPSVQNYLEAQAQREAVTQFSTIAGIPQVQTPAVPTAGAESIGQ